MVQTSMQHDVNRSKGTTATITPDELAGMLGVSRQGVYVGLRAGNIPSIRLGKRFVIPRAAIEQWLQTAGGSAQRREEGNTQLVGVAR